jgi:hypothetical protein
MKSLHRKRRLCDGVRLRRTSKKPATNGKVTRANFFAECAPIA